MEKTPKHNFLVVTGDLNAKVGSDVKGYERVMGKHGVGTNNDNGEKLCDLCGMNDLVITGTIFPHKEIHKQTWISPDRCTCGVRRTRYDTQKLENDGCRRIFRLELRNRFEILQREELEDDETDQPEAELEKANGILEKAYNMTAKKVLG